MRDTHRFLTRAPHCEPPIAGRTESRAAAHRAPIGSPHSGRSPVGSRGRALPPAEPVAIDPEAQRFAEHALRLTLEVLDRRRPPAQLRPLLAPALVDLVGALARRPAPALALGVAALHRVHLRPSGTDAAELFGTYSRGPRLFAVAARLERTPAAPGGSGWRVTSLQVG